jgi:flagellar biosynthesis GTPase FlhF
VRVASRARICARSAPHREPRAAAPTETPCALLCAADAPPAAQMGGIRPMVVCGPSGVGKGTLIAKLMARVQPRACVLPP